MTWYCPYRFNFEGDAGLCIGDLCQAYMLGSTIEGITDICKIYICKALGDVEIEREFKGKSDV